MFPKVLGRGDDDRRSSDNIIDQRDAGDLVRNGSAKSSNSDE
jgi:hypothetical protein